MIDSSERSIQLDFRCRSCGLAGLTPELTPQEAVCLRRGDLKLRCPKCGAILKIRTNALGLLAMYQGVSFLEVVRDELEQVLTQELERRDGD